MSKSEVCGYCGKTMSGRRCPICNGNGEVRHFIFSRKTCDYCGGSGLVYRCPNESEHSLERLRKLWNVPTHKSTLGADTVSNFKYSGINIPTSKSTSRVNSISNFKYSGRSTPYVRKCAGCGRPLGNSPGSYCTSCSAVHWYNSPANPNNPNSPMRRGR